MIELLGLLVIILGLGWMSLLVFFGTVPTFGEALFSGNRWEKLLGIVLWIVLILAWCWFFSGISVNVNVDY